MAFERVTENINELSDNVRAFGYDNAEYYKLKAFKKISRGAISLVNIMIIAFVCLIALLFLSVAVAMSISEALEYPSAGFYIVGGFYLLMFIFLLLVGKRMIRRKILIKTSRAFFND